MKCHEQFGDTNWRIQHVSLKSIIDLCYATCPIATQTLTPTLPSYQLIKGCIQYMASHPHNTIFYPSNSYDGSNFIRLTLIVNQVEYHKTQNYLEFHQDADHARIINKNGQFCVLYIIFLVFLSSRKYRFDQLDHLTTLMEQLDTCIQL